MPAYMIFTRTGPVTDQAEMDAYGAANRANGGTFVAQFGLKPLSAYGALDAVEGPAPEGIVLLEFPTADAARAWYASPEYQAALEHRLKGAPYTAVIIEGL